VRNHHPDASYVRVVGSQVQVSAELRIKSSATDVGYVLMVDIDPDVNPRPGRVNSPRAHLDNSLEYQLIHSLKLSAHGDRQQDNLPKSGPPRDAGWCAHGSDREEARARELKFSPLFGL